MEGFFAIKEWQDRKLSIEEQLSKILAIFEIQAEVELKERLEREERWRIRDEEERMEKQLKLRKQNELSSFKDLLHSARRWKEANLIREYIAEVKKVATEQNAMSEQFEERLTWAAKKADWYDPFIESIDELLDEVDPNSFAPGRELETLSRGIKKIYPYISSYGQTTRSQQWSQNDYFRNKKNFR